MFGKEGRREGWNFCCSLPGWECLGHGVSPACDPIIALWVFSAPCMSCVQTKKGLKMTFGVSSASSRSQGQTLVNGAVGVRVVVGKDPQDH